MAFFMCIIFSQIMQASISLLEMAMDRQTSGSMIFEKLKEYRK
jgi:hypothetical protein